MDKENSNYLPSLKIANYTDIDKQINSDNLNTKINNVSFKINYKNQTKRINHTPNSLAELKEIIKAIYNIEDQMKSLNISIEPNKHIQSEEDYQNLVSEGKGSTVKLFIEIDNSKLTVKNVIKDLISKKQTYNKNSSLPTAPLDKKLQDIVDKKFLVLENNMNKLMEDYNFSMSNSSIPIFENNENNVNKNLPNVNDVNNINSSNNNYNKDSIFFIQCDICFKYPITDTKYICLICDDLHLCEKCEPSHNHPLIKFKSPEFSSKEDVCNLIINPSNSPHKNKFSLKNVFLSKQDFFANIKEKFLQASKYKVNITMVDNYFLIKPNSTFKIPITIVNEGQNSLPQDTLIYIKNCKDIFFKIAKIGRLFTPKEKIQIEVECRTGSFMKEYLLEVNVYQKNMKIDYVPHEFKIKVCENIFEDDIEHSENSKSEINLIKSASFGGFNPEDTVSTLPSDKKEVLAEIIRNDLSSKDILEICTILDRHQWQLNEDVLREIK